MLGRQYDWVFGMYWRVEQIVRFFHVADRTAATLLPIIALMLSQDQQLLVMDADKNQAILEYKKLPNKVLELYHTEVPKEYGGKGIAKDLVKGAFRYCIDNNYKVYPTCSYVQKYSKDLATEEEKKIVVADIK
uniref:Protein NATD1 n=1 Tax=Meloidogyne hapla TaxID=6305 RepID=A0A1I8AYC7_MELHA